jgi:hypothetical protein
MIKLTKSTTTKVSAVFLATVLLAGIVALSSQSSFMTTGKDAQNKPFYGNLNIKAAYASSEESDDEERDGDHEERDRDKERDGDHEERDRDKERDGDHEERDRDKERDGDKEKDNNYNSFESIIINKLDNNDDKKSYGMDSYGSTDYQDDKVKKYNRYGSTDYGMDNDRESYDKKSYGNDYGYESQYSSYGKDDNRDKFKDNSKNVDIKKVKCKNINININAAGGSGTTTNGNTTNGNDNNGNKTDGFKKIDRDGFTFICINNNNNVAAGAGGGADDGGDNGGDNGNGQFPEECACFNEFPNGALMQLENYLNENPQTIGVTTDIDTVEKLCQALIINQPVDTEILVDLFQDAQPGMGGDELPEPWERLLTCLWEDGLLDTEPIFPS